MIDAYTIGITLALEDGVSDGLANVRRELEILDRAIAQSTAGMDELCRLGQKLGAVTESPSSVPPRPPIEAIPKPTPEGPPASYHLTQLPGSHLPVPPPARIASSPVVTTRPESDTVATFAASPVKPISTVPSIARAQTPPLSSPMPPEKKSGSQPDPNPSIPPITLQQFASKIVPVPHAPETSRANADIAPAFPGFADMYLPRSAPAPAAPTAAPDGDTTPAFDPAPTPPLSLRIATGNVAEPLEIGPPSAPVPAAPGDFATRSRHPTRAIGPIPSVRPAVQEVSSPPDLPVRSRASSQPTHVSGDIMLDGTRLGRWMGEMLTSALNRPAAGLTGVDPRAMPTWPTMQGR